MLLEIIRKCITCIETCIDMLNIHRLYMYQNIYIVSHTLYYIKVELPVPHMPYLL